MTDDDPIAIARSINERNAANTVIAQHAKRLPLVRFSHETGSWFVGLGGPLGDGRDYRGVRR